jgi:hypothetical protein
MVFTPDEPNIYLLNVNTWLILELCDGKSQQELEESYVAAVTPLVFPEEARRQLHQGLEMLKEGHIIEQVA